MKEWFKARNIWGAAITALSDEEAGRVAKAVWAYTMDGEIQTIEGAGKGILAMILMTLAQDEERDNDISAKRSYAAKVMHLQANADKCKQMQTNDSKCSNKNQNKNIDKEQESESELIAVTEARKIQLDHDTLIGAAENAGFKISHDVMDSMIRLYADYGLEKMLDGFKSCVKHGAVNLAYLEAVLKGKPRKPKVTAQDFEQRDYSDVQGDLMDSTAREVAEFLSKEVG